MHKAKNIYFLLVKKKEMAQGRVSSPILSYSFKFISVNTKPYVCST